MNRDFKKMFYSSLLTVFFIISNLVSLKYTSFMNLILPASFIVYPFVTLGLLLLYDTFGKKDTYHSIISTVFIQIFILFVYVLVLEFNVQSVILDVYDAVNIVFSIDQVKIITSLISFMISGYVLMHFVKTFNKIGQKFWGVLFGTIFSIGIYGLTNILVCYYGIEKEVLMNLTSSHVIISVISGIVVCILFYILKDRDCIYTEDELDTSTLNFDKPKSFDDKDVLEVLDIKEKVNKSSNKTKLEKVNGTSSNKNSKANISKITKK